MSFEKFLESASLGGSFNAARYVRNSKERQNISKNRLDPPASQSKYLKFGDYFTQKYDEVAGFRNVVALELTYELLLSIYDGNSKTIFVYRFMEWSKTMEMMLTKELAKIRAPGYEVRIIGLQNGENWGVVTDIINFAKKHRLPVFEVDLFGKEIRHISIDTKTGVSMDVLVNNRLYKPGELVNGITLEQFQRGIQEARERAAPA